MLGFTPQKPLINVELHAFFLSLPLHYDEKRNSTPLIHLVNIKWFLESLVL